MLSLTKQTLKSEQANSSVTWVTKWLPRAWGCCTSSCTFDIKATQRSRDRNCPANSYSLTWTDCNQFTNNCFADRLPICCHQSKWVFISKDISQGLKSISCQLTVFWLYSYRTGRLLTDTGHFVLFWYIIRPNLCPQNVTFEDLNCSLKTVINWNISLQYSHNVKSRNHVVFW